MTNSSSNTPGSARLRIAVIGTGNLASTLGATWVRSGQELSVFGRSFDRAAAVANEIGGTAIAASSVRAHDLVVLAVSPDGVQEALTLVGAPGGALAGVPLIDTTNPIDWTTGRHLLASGSFAEQVAHWAPGSLVVKALQSYAGHMWLNSPDPERTVALCGDDPAALELVARAVTALGGLSLVVGGLEVARQAEEATAFVARIAAAGGNPRLTVPALQPNRR
ncbi:NAD(P)-binding domain-containing protein [Nocardioides sp. CER19]|uniref:NADPH-dependent F420 reductase n=1 Tax=Nocardioides sp. CER19 TaxID=3038538 RepID=UPI0024468661|nr:NAD(P)-binding domain-containing protein [Nocardioides sp. CER19]MDH2414060.1 NAD(P)-binding domain-containing protein [Nocardioides sp. CER19]